MVFSGMENSAIFPAMLSMNSFPIRFIYRGVMDYVRFANTPLFLCLIIVNMIFLTNLTEIKDKSSQNYFSFIVSYIFKSNPIKLWYFFIPKHMKLYVRFRLNCWNYSTCILYAKFTKNSFSYIPKVTSSAGGGSPSPSSSATVGPYSVCLFKFLYTCEKL